MIKTLILFYLDYRNNYLTVAKMAEHNMLSESDCLNLIELGKKYMEIYYIENDTLMLK